MQLIPSSLREVATEVNFLQQPPTVVQAIAEKSVTALVAFSKTSSRSVDLNRIRQLF